MIFICPEIRSHMRHYGFGRVLEQEEDGRCRGELAAVARD